MGLRDPQVGTAEGPHGAPSTRTPQLPAGTELCAQPTCMQPLAPAPSVGCHVAPRSQKERAAVQLQGQADGTSDSARADVAR